MKLSFINSLHYYIIKALIGVKPNKKDDDDAGFGEGDSPDVPAKQQLKLGGDPKLKHLVFEMRVKNQVIYAHPNTNMIMKVGATSSNYLILSNFVLN